MLIVCIFHFSVEHFSQPLGYGFFEIQCENMIEPYCSLDLIIQSRKNPYVRLKTIVQQPLCDTALLSKNEGRTPFNAFAS